MHKTPNPARPILGLFLLGCCLAAVLPARPVAASEASPVGVNIHIPQGSELASILDRVQVVGIGWVRIDFIWAVVETAPNRYDWAAYDALAAAARARGLEVYATIAYTPAWATAGPELSGVPSRPQDWSEFCGQAAARYRGAIRYWGVWNEPNLPRFWAGTREQYLDIILKPCADAIHAAAPEAKVAGPDLAHLTSGDSDWYHWLREVLETAGNRLDIVTHHLYDSDGHSDVTNKLGGSTLFGGRPAFWNAVPPSVEEVLQYAGAQDKPFWLTETGWESADVGEARQASYSTGLLEHWLTGQPGRDWVDKIFFYEMKDPPGDEFTWGLLRANGAPKPVYEAIRDFIGRSLPAVDEALVVSDTFPTRMETGQRLEVQVRVRNTGTSAWTRSQDYALGAWGDSDPFAAVRQPLEPGESVAPGQEKTFTMVFQAPAAPGTYETDWRMVREGQGWFGPILRRTVTVAAAPTAQQRTLSLLGSRFAVEVSWRDQHNNRAGYARALPGSDQTGYFWFFDAANVELVVKMLDATTFNGYHWVFYGALSDVEYWIQVTDRQTGRVKRYHNPPGNICGKGDTIAFRSPSSPGASASAGTAVPLAAVTFEDVDPEAATAPSAPETSLFVLPVESAAALTPATAAQTGACTPFGTTLCLLGNRFRVEVEWRDQHNGGNGLGTAVPGTDQTGYFWFFSPSNIELVVKILDGRTLNNKFWVFYGALSDVEYWITVTDTVTGARKRYHNRPGNICGVGDTQAL